MGLDRSLVGVPSEPQLRSWDSKDALLYAVGVGAGLGSPLEELEFTTENCEGIEQKVLPTFGVLIAQARAGRSLGDFNRAMLVHAEQFFELHRPLPVTGTVRTVSTVTGIYDKGSGALVVSENVAVDAAYRRAARDRAERDVHPRRRRLRRPARRRPAVGAPGPGARSAGRLADQARAGADLPPVR